jgi:hypothetical protein
VQQPGVEREWSVVSLTPEQRSQRARIAALSRWAKEDPAEHVAKMRRGFVQRFLDLADPDGVLDERERARRAEVLMREHMERMSFAASKKRGAR